MQPIEAVGVEVVSHAVPTPALPSPGVRTVALRHGPAHTQVRGLCCNKGLHTVHHHLVVPLLVLSGALARAQEDVGPHAVGGTRQGISITSSARAWGVSVSYLPGDIVHNVGLQQQVAAWEQVFSDEVLVGPHSYTVTHTQRAQDVQNLKANTRLSVLSLFWQS